VITCVALVNNQTDLGRQPLGVRVAVGDTVIDRLSLCKDYPDHLADNETQELWDEMRDRFHLLSSDVPTRKTSLWTRPRPIVPWTDRCAISRYHASRTVALMLEAAVVQRQQDMLTKKSAAVTDGGVDVRPENETKLQQVLGRCGLEFMELMTVCPPNDTNDSEANKTQSTAIYTLVYAVEQLDQIPEKARADPRYRVLDQTRDAALLDSSRNDGVAQFPQLFPLRHVFQAQISELGALLAVADALTRGTPRHETAGSRKGTTAS
jgi:hypothetical protein